MNTFERTQELPIAIDQVSLLSGPGQVLAAVLQDPQATMREISRRCRKTERAVWQVLVRLERAGLVRRSKHGRRNQYEVDLPALERQLRGEASPLFARAGRLPPQSRQPAGLELLPASV